MLIFFIPLMSGCGAWDISGTDRQDVTQEVEVTATPYVITATPEISTTTPDFILMPTEDVFVCQVTKGSIEYRELVTSNLSYPLGLRVYLPPCYGIEPDRFYPVVYLLHGQGFNDDQWDRLGADEIADQLIISGETPPFMIVMPRESNFMEDDKVSQYGNALANSLIPWIDQEYKTCSVRECRAIGGISRGAAWAVRTGFEYWQIFGAIGAHSFAPFSGDFYNSPYWFADIPEGDLPRVYLDMGSTDGLKVAAGLFEGRLTDYNIPHEWVINTGTHNEEYWSAHVEDYLRWYTFPWHLETLSNDQSAIFAITPTAPVPESE
jgi:S-formylglutathione hydrolase FrmB